MPLFALGFPPLFRRRRYGEHLVFSIHFFALLLLFMITVMYAVFQLMVLLVRATTTTPAGASNVAILAILDSEATLVFMIYFPIYLYLIVALRRVYGGGRLVNALKAFILICWHIVMLVVVFKTSLFFTTFYSLKWFG